MSRVLAMMARTRRLVVEEARQGLAAALEAETAAEAVAREAAAAIGREQALASAPEADDRVVEAYIGWLPEATARLARSRATLDRANAISSQARARLNAARAAAEAVTRKQAADAALLREERERREQAALDEVAQLSTSRPGKT